MWLGLTKFVDVFHYRALRKGEVVCNLSLLIPLRLIIQHPCSPEAKHKWSTKHQRKFDVSPDYYEDILDLIKSRIDAFKRGETMALKFVKIYFRRRKQRHITEVSRLSMEAGVDVKLDLIYAPESSTFYVHRSGSHSTIVCIIELIGMCLLALSVCDYLTISSRQRFERTKYVRYLPAGLHL